MSAAVLMALTIKKFGVLIVVGEVDCQLMVGKINRRSCYRGIFPGEDRRLRNLC
jgi:hypothetical protein